MATIVFSNGQKVNFNGTPTPQDVDYVAKQIGVSANSPAAQPAPVKKSIGQKILDVGTKVSDFIGGKSIADTYGAEIAKRQNPALAPYIDQPSVRETVGSGLQVGSLLAPVGEAAGAAKLGLEALGTAPKLAKLGGNIVAGAGTGYGFDVGGNLQAGKKGAEAFQPGLATALGGVIPAAPAVLGGAARAAGESLGVTTGTGYGVIKEAMNAASQGGERATAFTEALRGKTTPDQIVEEARNSLGDVIRNRSQAYQTSLGKLATKTKQFDTTPVAEKFNSLLEESGVTFDKKGVPDFSRSPGLGRFQKDLTDLSKVIADWGKKPGDLTITGIDKLKQTIDEFRYGSQDARRFDRFVTSLRNEAKNLGKNEPEYLKMTKGYEESTGLIREIQRGLSLGDKAQTDTAFRKLSSVLRTNNEFRKELLDELNKASGGFLTSKIAGQQLSEALPRGLARQIEGFGALGTVLAGGAPAFLALAKVAAFASPRVVGELVNALGISKRVFYDLLDRVGAKTAQFPGDQFLQSPTGQKAVNYVKNAQPGLSMKDVSGRGMSPVPKSLGADAPFQGFEDVTSKILDDLKGRTTVNKQYLLDALNRPEIKQAEKNIVRDLLKDEPAQVGVKRFAANLKSELLPLNTAEPKNISEYRGQRGRYESINLPDELRGPVSDYKEKVYESPIKTSAGDVHFSAARDGTPENYFAHSRIEDLPPSGMVGKHADVARKAGFTTTGGSTRRVIELQSDLFQKGRLENEGVPRSIKSTEEHLAKIKGYKENGAKFFDGDPSKPIDVEIARYEKMLADQKVDKDATEFAKLEPYRNTWHERVIREEVKQAAKDGKTKLQFPTGETAMKIEGLGDAVRPWRIYDDADNFLDNLTPDNMKVGQRLDDGASGDWIITDVLGDGKFKAASTMVLDNTYEVMQKAVDLKLIKELSSEAVEDAGGWSKLISKSAELRKAIGTATEQFDISGKVDTNNPIYKFYEKEVGKYLQKKYAAKMITDPQGVTWWELNVPKEKASLPVEAFAAIPGVLGLGGLQSSQNRQKAPPPTPQVL